MDAKELYALSVQKKRNTGLSNRVRNVAMRAGLDEGGTVDPNKVYAAIYSGAIWKMKGMGIGTVMTLCEWVVDAVGAEHKE